MRRAIPVIGLLLAFSASCGPGARQKALGVSLASLDASRDGFVAWDEHKQQTIVADSTSLEQGKTALADYRTKRAAIIEGFTVAYSALALAALDSNGARLTEAISTAATVYKLIKDLAGEN